MRSLNRLVWRNLQQHRLRAVLSALAVGLGVAMVIASSGINQAITNVGAAMEDSQSTAGILGAQLESSLTMIGLVILAMAAFLVFNAFAMSVTQRRQEIGSLRALGLTRRQVIKLMLLEALLTGSAGTACGLMAGPLMGRGVVAVLGKVASIRYGHGWPSWRSMLVASALGLSITLLSMGFPARRATRISPLAALHSHTVPKGKAIPGWLAPVGSLGIVIMISYLCLVPPSEHVAVWMENLGLPVPLDAILIGGLSFLWLGCLALTLPALTQNLGRWLRGPLSRLWGAVGRLMADNLQRDQRRVLLTVLTLALSLTMIVAVVGALGLMAELMITYYTRQQIPPRWALFPVGWSGDMVSWQTISEIDLATMGVTDDLYQDTVDAFGDRAEILRVRAAIVPKLDVLPGSMSFFLDARQMQRMALFDFYAGDWDTALPILESGCGVLITPGLARQHKVWLYDTLTLPGVDGSVECTVAGLGLSANFGASLVGDVAAAEFNLPQKPFGLFVQPLSASDKDEFEAELHDFFARHPNVYLMNLRDINDFMIPMVEGMLMMLNGPLFLAITAAALGVINTTAMSVTERRRELGLLRAIGATRSQARRVVMGEAALMGLIGGGLGLMAGAGIVFILVMAGDHSTWGLRDLALWPLAGRVLRLSLRNGLFGALASPFICTVAAWLPARAPLRGTAVETMDARRQPEATRRAPHVRKGLMRSLNVLAWRTLGQSRLRTTLTVLGVTLGVATTVSAGMIRAALLNSLAGSEDAQAFMTGLLEQLGVTLDMIGVGITLAAGFLIFNAFAMAVTQRRQQIGGLRALGMTRHQVLRLVLIESLIVGSLGTVLGLATGPLLGKGIIMLMKAMLGEGVFVFAASNPALPSLLLAAALGMGVALLSALVPAWQAARVSPLTALREDLQRSTQSGFLRYALVGAGILLTLTVYLVIAPPGEWVAYPWDQNLAAACVLLWIVGWGLIAPALLGGMGRWLRGLFSARWGAVGRLVADNLQRGRGRATLTLLTLVVGLTMIVGLTGFIQMVSDLLIPSLVGFERLRALIFAPFDISSGMAGYADLERIALPPDLLTDLPQVVGDRARVMDEWRFVIVPELSFFSSSYFSFVADPRDVQFSDDVFFDFVEGDWATAMPIMESGCGVLVPPMIASRNGVSVGETFEVTGKDGPVRCTLAGIGQTWVNASIISLAAKDDFPVTAPFLVHVVPLPGNDREQLKADLTTLAAGYADVHLMEPEGMYSAQVKVIEALPDMLNALLLLALVAAALGVVNTTMMNVAERRRELGLLRAVGATRRQVRNVVVGEAALMGAVGGGLGLLVGVGVVIIIVVTYGGNSWGVPDLDLWEAAWRSAQPALVNALIGLIAAPFLCAVAAWLPARSILRSSAIETLEAARQAPISPRQAVTGFLSRGSLRTRFVLGTAALLIIVLVGLIGVVTTHARTHAEAQMHDALRTLVTWNAGMLELGLPDDAERLDVNTLMAGNDDFDAEALLRFESLMDDMTANGLVDFAITDRDNVVLISLDPRDIGTLAPDLERADEVYITSERHTTCPPQSQRWLMYASAPIHNKDNLVLGSVRLTIDAEEMRDFLSKLRNTLGGVGMLIVIVGMAISWALATPLTRATRQLALHATEIGRGDYTLFPHPSRPPLSHFSLHTKLTVAIVLIVVLMVVGLQAVTLPIERRHIEGTLKDGLLAGVEWIGQAVSESLGAELDEVSLEQFVSFEELLKRTQTLDLARLQEMTEQMRSEDAAFVALVDEDGTIIMADQLSLMGDEVPVPPRAQVEESTWRGAEVWIASTPLRRGQNGELVGALRLGVRRDRIETFLDESRALFRLTGVIAVLAGVLLAQVIGGAVSAPVRQLAAGTRRVAASDLSVQFDLNTKDELAILVIYGAPRKLQPSERRAIAYQAVLTALDMRANLKSLNEKLIARGDAPIHIGVGINTGVVLAGTVGPEERQEYTVIGDTVNLASRIEALNKQYPDYNIIISGQTYKALENHRDEFELVDLGNVQIRGKVKPVRVWAVVGMRK